MKTKSETRRITFPLSGKLYSTARIGLWLVLAVVFSPLAACRNAGTQPQTQPPPTTPVSSTGEPSAARPAVSYADVVDKVEKGSPAERAGLRQGDVILAFDGNPVSDGNSLRNRVAGTQPGTEVTLTIFRDGREQPVRVTLGEFVPATPGRG